VLGTHLTITLRNSLCYYAYMTYTVHKLAELAGISVRTLHYYDETGLLKPAFIEKNGYRAYGGKELLKLQQILFFRELEFPLEDIKSILTAPDFDIAEALRDHRKLILLKRKRLDGLIRTINSTITSITKKTKMDDKQLYGSFSKKEMEELAKEAKQKWGTTDAYKQSAERVAKMSKGDLARIQKEGDELLAEIATHIGEDPGSPPVQELIGRHYGALRAFYEPNVKLYRGLANMYIADPRFVAYYEKRGAGLAEFMHAAMLRYCDAMEK
jgi:DNA-binding transcriptional MerR regulator